jgi:replication-associated recombination protein RarA
MREAMRYRTVGGHDLGDVTSAMQKAIRRGDARLAGYWAIELFESGYHEYIWRRLLTISAEDCWGILTQEVAGLRAAFREVNARPSKDRKTRGRIFIAKAVILLAAAKKSRDADHLTNLVYDADGVDAETLTRELEETRRSPEAVEIPDYALDCHTRRGKDAGKTKRDFFLEEYDALAPRQPGLFDDDLERLRGNADESLDGKRGGARLSERVAGQGHPHKGRKGRVRYIDPSVEKFSEPGWEMRGLTSSGRQIWILRGDSA